MELAERPSPCRGYHRCYKEGSVFTPLVDPLWHCHREDIRYRVRHLRYDRRHQRAHHEPSAAHLGAHVPHHRRSPNVGSRMLDGVPPSEEHTGCTDPHLRRAIVIFTASSWLYPRHCLVLGIGVCARRREDVRARSYPYIRLNNMELVAKVLPTRRRRSDSVYFHFRGLPNSTDT